MPKANIKRIRHEEDSVVPIPKAKDVCQKLGVKHKVADATVATSSPFKEKLLAQHAENSAKCAKVATTSKKCPEKQLKKVQKLDE